MEKLGNGAVETLILSEEDKRRILVQFNDTKREYPKDKTISELFEEQVKRMPDSIAVVYEDRMLTYRELNERSNSLAKILREKGVEEDSIVGIMAERSLEMIVGIISILKAGGAYLPIDSDYPIDRIKYMLKDSRADILLASESMGKGLGYEGNIINLNDEKIYRENKENLENTGNSESLAYIIYTSGTTGKPKGVAVTQKNVVRLVKNTNYIEFKEDDRILQTGSVAFDASTFEIWGALLNGIRLYITSKDVILNGERLAQCLSANQITILWLTSPLFNKLCEEDPSIFKELRYLLAGGDVVSPKNVNLVRKLAPSLTVVNGYGPTENTTFSTCYVIREEFDENKPLPIGKPIANSTAYILDQNNNIVPIGVYGELCVGGEGLARGYLNNEELTSQKFVENPYEPGQKMYRTGDLTRWLPDGNIEFSGRIDHQVKIRGFRIELGEIEISLLKINGVKEAVVIDREEEGNKYLCAYLVSEEEYSAGKLREELKKSLPDYMLPSYFITLEEMPLNQNGKIDRKALPKPEGKIETGIEYAAARNEVEEKLVKIWEEVLAISRIGIDDDFFILGGHSLKAIKIVSFMQKDLEASITVGEIFSNSTIRKLGEYIGKAKESDYLAENEYSAIEAVEEKEAYVVSSAQKRMFAVNQFSKEETNYNIPRVLILDGKLEKNKIEETFKKLIERHEAFRTSFEIINDEIMQRIHKKVEFKLEYEEISNISEEIVNGEVEKFVKPFDLSKAPLLRAKLIKVAEEEHILIFDMHHIITDGTSMGIIMDEFTRFYRGESLDELRVQYKDYALWESKLLQSEEVKKQGQYWKEVFSDDIPGLDLPTDYQRPAIQSFEGENIGFRVEKELTEKLRQVGKNNGATLYMILLSAYNVLLSKYSGQEDIIVGSPIAGRPHADLQGVVGMFVNTLAMRNYPVGKKRFNEFLQEVKESSLKAYENQDYQFDTLVEALDIRKDLSRNPLFDTMFVLQNTDNTKIEMDNIKIKEFEYRDEASKFDMTLEAEEKGEEIKFNLQYCTKLFKRERAEKLIQHYINILKEVAEKPELRLWKINMLSEGEKRELLEDFNNTKTEYPKNRTIYEIFEEQVEKSPESIAVTYKDKKLTYRELNDRANQLARVLREKGVKEDIVVGIMVERSLEMIVGIMAIIKAGGAYLPISTEYPEDRIKYMLEDSNSSILLTQGSFIEKLSFNGIAVDLEDESLYKGDRGNIGKVNNSRNLAYIIYTSGSTGNPKGVMIEHKSVINLVNALYRNIYVKYGENIRIAVMAPYVFDASVKQIFPSLLMGHTLCIVPEDVRRDGEKLIKYYNENSVDVSDGTPMHLEMLLNELETGLREELKLKHLIIGGDILPRKSVERFVKNSNSKNCRITNIYGPTECCVDTTAYLVEEEKIEEVEAISIGSPLANQKVYILNKDMMPVPVGISGEMYISGEGVARGYINNLKLTQEKFIDNPFIPGERMYKTGDLARWLSDGNVDFIGRVDRQVKIRGYRIELGEIESELLKNEDIKEAVVLDKQDGQGNKYLCAYIVAEREITVPELRKSLSQRLPDYMIPAYFIQIEKMPLTTNGKVNRRALPEPSGEINTGIEYVAPRNETEEKLIKIWNEVLGIENIGIDDDFFAIGGHSLRAIKMVSIIQRELETSISVSEIFSSPTVRSLGEYIGKNKETVYSSIEAVEEREVYEVSSAQKRLFALNQFSKEETSYNIPIVMLVEGKLEKEKVEKSFKKLVERHEAFRTSFELVDDEIMQRIHKAAHFAMEYEETNKAVEELVYSFIKPFDLSKAPLLRVKLVKLEEEKFILMLDMHHIISDGSSMGIIMDEFTRLYKGENLEPLRIQYKDYSVFENKMMASEIMKNQEEYWTKVFSDDIPILDLPTDYPRPTLQSFEGENILFTIPRELSEKLKKIGKSNGATLYMTLLSAFNILLSKYSGQEDIIVGSPIAGRPHADLQGVVGMFVNTLAMRSYPEGKKTFNEFLQEVKKNSLGAYENQAYQFDKLVEKLDIRRDLSRNALFDTAFVLQNTDNKEIQLDNIVIKQYEFNNRIAKFDITLEAEEHGNEIVFNLEYCTKLFKSDTIEKMINHFTNILKAVADNPKIMLAEIDMLSEEEKSHILFDFNKTSLEYPKYKTIKELFEEQAEKTPDNIAVVFEDKKLTYRELNEKSNQLAVLLREKGVKADSIVGLMVERSLEMMIGILGTLKAGGAYLPINPSYPEDRIKYMLEDSGTHILLTHEHFKNKISCHCYIIALEDEAIYRHSNSNLASINDSEALAYIIYTSGSTGNPKGVMISHKALNNFIFNLYNNFGKKVGTGDNCLSLTNIAFDVSVCEIFMPIVFGATLVFFNNDMIPDIEKLARTIIDREITFAYIPPTILKQVHELVSKEKTKLNKMLVGVESIRDYTLEDYMNLNTDMQIVNGYGPTEATICATFYKYDSTIIPSGKIVPIGKPLGNTKIYIIDKNHKLVPEGTIGELCISGDGLARGYLNNSKLTEEKFAANPFEQGEKMYNTGDLARWLPDGNIEFIGRIDHQVKIRGFRIELGEIENQLLKNDAIKEAVVIDKQDGQGNKYLCAYLTAEREIAVSELRGSLSKILPEYMIPAYFIQINIMPLTPNGKVNRKALPEPDGEINTGIEYVAPRNDTEEKLIKIWNEVLEVERIGINDDFFTLGGHSLKAIKMVSIIQRELETSISVSEVFSNPTVRLIGEYIAKGKKSLYSSIKAVEEREIYKVSSAQKRMYALYQFSKDETNYNMPLMLLIDGKLDKNKVEESFGKLIERHEAFRTSFEVVNDEIIQRIHKAVEFKVEYEELKEWSEEIVKSAAEEFIKPFDLSKAPLLRVKLVRLEVEKHMLMVDMHHIVSDGESMAIIMEEFTKLYKGEALEKLNIQYKDYSAWETEMLASDSMKNQEQFWMEIFSDELPILDLPTDFPRPSVQSFEGESIAFTLDKELTERVRKICKANGATLYMTLLSAYNVLLSKYSGQEDIIVGSAIAGRPQAELHNMVGMFVNTLAMRNYAEGNKTFNEFVMDVKKNALRVYENQDYQFDRLVEKLDIRRDLSRNAIFDTMFVLQNTDNKEIELDNSKIKKYELENRVAKFDLTLAAEEKGAEVKLVLEYCTKLFKKETIARAAQHFINILEAVTVNPEIKLAEIDMLSEEEKRKLLVDFNDTRVEYPKDKTICELFEEQVEKTPENIAVVYKDEKLTYKELNEKSNQLAGILRAKGVVPESIVGIMVEGSLEMLIGIMGILKAGGAYLPIDPEYPKDRIEYMLEDSSTKILLTQSVFVDKLSFSGSVIDLKDKKLYEGSMRNLVRVNDSNNLAYIIYTSGSTGKPKGVMIEHKALVNLCQWHNSCYSVTENDRSTKYAGFGFDASVWEIFPYIVTGAALHIISSEIRLDIDKLNRYFENNNITISFMPTQICEQFMAENNTSLRKLLTGGDKLQIFKKNNYDLINNYGPTENTVVTAAFEVRKSYTNIPIGKPISNSKIYILSKDNKLQPVGVAGELCIAGDGLARGYLNRPELTEEKFTANPFEPGEKMYRSGDLARWLPDGNIEFMGRIDHQVKIRGYRIELGEIENQLLKNEEIKEAVVLDKQDGQGNKYLCAYVVGEKEVSIAEIKGNLSKILPDYMIPASFIQLENIPLTQNGKVNRRALPEPEGGINTGAEYVAPRNKTEEKLAEIWSEVLEAEKIGIDDDFFALGGHSLKAIKMVSIIQRELRVEIPVGDVFSNTTIRTLGEYIGKAKKSVYSSIEAVEEREFHPVSSAQKRMFALNQFAKEDTNYNMPSVMIFEGKLHKHRVEDSFKKLVKRHEAFRTSFELAENEIMQRIHKEVEFKMEYEEMSNSDAAIKAAVEKFIRPFDLSIAPLLRVKLVTLEEEKYILMFDMHHIISDGESMSIIMDEFTELYKGERLEELRIQYKDYSAWENELLESETMKKHEEYWIKVFSNNLPVLDLPTDYPRPTIQSFEGSTVDFSIDKTLTEKLKKVCKANGATLYMTLLSAYNILLSKYSGQEDIIVGSPTAGRPHAELHSMVGMFVNTLAMRNYPEGNKNYNEFLQEVKKNSLGAYENQNYQFDKLVEKLDIKRDLSRSALFDTMFVLQNIADREIALDNISIKPYEFENKVSKFDLKLAAAESDEEIDFTLEYSTKLFKRETIERMASHFKNVLREIADNPQIKLCEVNMLSKEEERKILAEFNNTKADFSITMGIHQLFEAQAALVPDYTAVTFEGESYGYKELNERANRLANYLNALGVTVGGKVAVYMERSLEIMVGIMGALKAGAAYIPIDPTYPKDRIEYMIEETDASVIITTSDLAAEINNIKNINIFSIDSQWELVESYGKENLNLNIPPSSAAYMIFTSGSTGKPKGVVIKHSNIVNYAEGILRELKLERGLSYAIVTTFAADLGLTALWGALCSGGQLHIISYDRAADPTSFEEYFKKNHIDVLKIVPSHFEALKAAADIKNIIPNKYLIFGGESSNWETIANVRAIKPECTIVNHYGPTESTVGVLTYKIKDVPEKGNLQNVPLGKPLANSRAYILDKFMKPVPVGVPGELYIGGEGITAGYLNRPEVTAEKFITHGFLGEEEQKLYRTGDLARLLRDGNIEFLGRIDNQVKIRGYRIEIGEIEALIKGYPTVQDSVVIVREDKPGDKRLAAYIVPKAAADEKYSDSALREYLKKQLPKYMVPATFVQLESIPLNANGKVDRFALPAPDMHQRDTEDSFIAPRNKEEIEMAKKWAETLGIDKIGIDDDFFDLGGDSFKAIKLVRSISSTLGVMELFKHSTIRELVAYLSKDDSEESERIMLHELTKSINIKDKVVSVICFPYGGGSAISYQALANVMPKNYSLYSVELPGHDYSCPNEELASIEEAAARCFVEIKEKVKGPIVLYGHCLGAAMATVMAYKLEEAGIKVDGVLIGAMFPAPRISNKFFKIWDKVFPSQASDRGNKDLLKSIGGLNDSISSEETEFILRNLKHDLKETTKCFTEFFTHKERAKFKAPISCLVGEGDRGTQFYEERYKEWEHFSDDVDLKVVKQAGHFFFKSHAVELAHIIKDKVDLWQGRSLTKPQLSKLQNEEIIKTPARKQIAPSMNLFLIVAVVQIISQIGTILSSFGTGIWVYKHTGALSQFAMMFLLGVIPTIVILPISGAVVDRIDRRIILIGSDIISAVCSLGLLTLLFTNGLQIWHVYIFTIVASVATAFRQPAYMAAVTQISPKMYLMQANSVSQFSVAIGGILAPICGGVFMNFIGFKGLVAIDLATFIISISALSLVRFPDTMFSRQEEPIHKELIGGWNFIIKRRSLVVMVIFFLVSNFLMSIFDVIITPLILTYSNTSVLGIVNAFSGVGVLCGSIIMLVTGGTRKRAKGMVGFVVFVALSITIAGLRPSPVFAALALLGFSLSLTIVNIHWQSLIQVKVGLELQGRVFAINQMMASILRPISYLTAGVLADKVFAPIIKTSIFNSSIVKLILGTGEGRAMRLILLIVGSVLLLWSVAGFKYKPLSEMDDMLEDALPGDIVIKDKDKIQEMADSRINSKSHSISSNTKGEAM